MADTRTPKEFRMDDTEVEIWFNRLERSYRARRPHQERWRVLKEYYAGRYNTGFGNGFSSGIDGDRSDGFFGFNNMFLKEDSVASMLHFVTTRQMASALYFQDPSMNFVGRTEQGMADAMVSEQVLMRERKIIHAEVQERLQVDDALKYGTGILMHAWNGEFGEDPAFADAKKRKPDSMEGALGSVARDEDLRVKQGAMTEHNTNMVFGHPWVKRIRPIDFLIDPDAITYEEAGWVARRFHRRWVDAIRDERWDKRARAELEESGPTGHSPFFVGDLSEDWEQKDPIARDSSLTTFYEIWDKTTQRLITVTDMIKQPLEVKSYPFLGKDGPYEILQFFPVDDTFWAISYMDTFTSEVLASNKLQTSIYDHNLRFAKSRGFYVESLIDAKDMNRLSKTKDGEYIGVRLPDGKKIADIIQSLDQPPVNADNYRILDIMNAKLREISGVSENDLGSGKGVQTATEASIIQQQSGLRKGDMRFSVDRALAGSARKTMSLLRQFWTGEQVIPIVGPDGQRWNVPVSKQLLNGEFDVDIEPGSTERVDRQARSRQAVEIYREALNSVEIMRSMGFMLNLPALFKILLRESDLVKNPDRIIIPVATQPQQQPQPGLAGPGQPGQQQLVGQTPGLSTVNAQGDIPQATDAFESGRGLSEGQARFN